MTVEGPCVEQQTERSNNVAPRSWSAIAADTFSGSTQSRLDLSSLTSWNNNLLNADDLLKSDAGSSFSIDFGAQRLAESDSPLKPRETELQTVTEKKIADALSTAIESKDRKAVKEIIEKYSEWPRALARIIEGVNRKYQDQKSGSVLVFHYYERSNIISSSGDSKRRADPDHCETGFATYYLSSWADKEQTGPKKPMRIYEKDAPRTVRTSAYVRDANDINQPLKFNREDMGESLPPF